VVLYDGRGNGRSGDPDPSGLWQHRWYADDCRTVLDATGTERAVLAGLCGDGVYPAMQVAAEDTERVQAVVALAPGVPLLTPPHPFRADALATFEDQIADPVGWQKYNRRYIHGNHEDFLQFFFGEMFPEPHSSKHVEDAVRFGLDGSVDVLLMDDDLEVTKDEVEQLCRQVRCPVLVVHGDQVEGSGHLPNARHPVLVNTLIKDFVEEVSSPMTGQTTPWLFARERKRRALWVCSPIGLGHTLRDLAIAKSLRERVPDLEIEWLAQSPVSDVVRAHGEVVHPASDQLASESAHWESESDRHDLHAFYAFRRMDEILLANYMLFDDVVRETPYDLWIGDESWEVDHFLHENPERKIAPYVFMTDVVGFLPVDPEGDAREAELVADYNAEMIEHRERFPFVRDLSVFIGGYDELPDAPLGPSLPTVRDWTEQWFSTVPYVVPFDPGAYRRPQALRRRLGYGTGYPLYIAAVGGTAVGRSLLELTAEAFALVRKEQPDARMVMVTGPRLDPGLLPDVEGMEKRGYVDSLFEHLACADVAVVQGGLSTTMELTAARRPFIYFPLAHHWEQQHFVSHRLDHYGAGHRMDYRITSPRDLADALMSARRTRPAYRPIRRGGADKAAGLLASVVTGSR
jgi:predicted glycosyltransferase/pimeloyl-ACP methyl ester carboxylesterase